MGKRRGQESPDRRLPPPRYTVIFSAQQRIIKHLIVPYANADFYQEYLHEHAGGRLSAFFKKDLIKIRPINNSSLWRRAAAHLINAFIKKDANKYFTETFPNFIQTAGSVDGATVCAKLVSMIHDLPLVSEDPTIICQIDFANAFQTPNRQLGTNDCILGRASREYDGGRVKIGDNLPHLAVLRNFFPYVSSVNEWQAEIVSRTMTVGMVLTTRYLYPPPHMTCLWRRPRMCVSKMRLDGHDNQLLYVSSSYDMHVSSSSFDMRERMMMMMPFICSCRNKK